MLKRRALVVAFALFPVMGWAQYAGGGGGGAIPECSGDQAAFGVCLDTSTGDLIWEGATADAFEGSLVAPTISGDWTWTLPSGTTTLAGYAVAGTFTAAQTFSAALGMPAGTKTAPALDWDVGTGTGFYQPSENDLGIVSGGKEGFRFVGFAPYLGIGIIGQDAYVRLGLNEYLAWTDNDSATSGTLDVGIDRNAAGILGITNGSTGNGSLLIGGAAQLRLADDGTKPTCDATTRGSIWYEAGGAGVLDTLEICRKDAGDAYAWVTLF